MWTYSIKNADVVSFLDMLTSLDLVQHVQVPTHCNGYILDLVITTSSDAINSISVTKALFSDHHMVSCKAPVRRPPAPPAKGL